MTTNSTTARYVIAADDKTKSAIASIQSGFKNLDRGVKSTVRNLNLALGVFVGVQLKQAMRNILQATAESTEGQKGFADALGEVKANFRDLMVARDGLPGATESMKELAGILKDPTVREAADSLTSTLITGFAESAKFIAMTVAGLKIALTGKGGNEAVNVDNQILDYERSIRHLQVLMKQDEKFGAQESRRYKRNAASLAEFEKLLAAARIKWQELVSLPPVEVVTEDELKKSRELAEAIGDLRIDTGDIESAVKESSDEFWKSIEAEAKARDEQIERERDLARVSKELDREIAEDRRENIEKLTRETETSYQRQQRSVDEFKAKLQELRDLEAISPAESDRRLADFLETLNTMSTYADQAARNMQDAFAQFLFDPFEDGLKGMLKGFIDVLRRMIAEAAAAQIFGSKKDGGLGVGDLISTGIGALFGGFRANGGPVSAGKYYRVNEREPEYFAPSSGGSVIPLSRMSALAGGGSITVVNNNHFNNMRDVSDAKLAAAGQRISDVTVARVRDLKRRGRM